MPLKPLPSECIAPLRLKEITLHGIGSYVRPATLEIRPLTILCGTNGSGKSTWLKALDALREAVNGGPEPSDDPLPFLSSVVRAVSKRSLVNVYSDGSKRESDWPTPQGPFGSIGLLFRCAKSLRLSSLGELPGDTQIPVLTTEQLRKGDSVRVRLTLNTETAKAGGVLDWAGCRVAINDGWAEVRNRPRPESGGSPSVGSCKFLSGTADRTSDASEDLDLAQALLERAREILTAYFTGHFHISAIRPIQDRAPDYTEVRERMERIGCTRYVGKRGEDTHHFRLYYDLIPVYDPRGRVPYCGWGWPAGRTPATTAELVRKKAGKLPTDDSDLDAALAERSMPERPGPRAVLLDPGMPKELAGVFGDAESLWYENGCLQFECFWRYLYDEHRNVLERFQQRIAALSPPNQPVAATGALLFELHEAMRTGSFRTVPAKLAEWRSNAPRHHVPVVERILKGIRNLIDRTLVSRPDFVRWFLAAIRKYPPSQHDYIGMWAGRRSYAWAEFLASLPDDRLHPSDLEALRVWTVDRTRRDLGDTEDNDIHADVCRCAHDLFASWSRHLVGVDAHRSGRHDDSDYRPTINWSAPEDLPVGFLSVFDEGDGDPFAPLAEPGRPYRNALLGYSNVCPGLLSAGFHQIAPILVQMNMMKMNEVLAVENPEVHLHPGLQLKFASFFIENALIGKYSLIETHSDLFIRRVMRAIAEEKLPQNWVNIAFVQVEDVKLEDGEVARSATLQGIQTDENGVFTNWPEGFLGDDVRESEDLLRAMYGDRSHTTEDTNG